MELATDWKKTIKQVRTLPERPADGGWTGGGIGYMSLWSRLEDCRDGGIRSE